jgi:hypothetical protein
VAVGNPKLKSVEPVNRINAQHFDLYKVELPQPAFRGFPPEWMFIILRRIEAITDEEARESVIQEARRLSSMHFGHLPLVLVSDDRNIQLGSEFNFAARNVFCLDAPDLPKQEEYSTNPRTAPFVLALRNKMQSEQIRAFFSPYQKQHPVSGWRFFGRKRELYELVNSQSNIAVVGGRRVGKTSLLQEAKRLLEENGEKVYFLDVQRCLTANDVTNVILQALDPKEVTSAIRRGKALGEPVLAAVLKRVTHGEERTTLLFDELGNVLSRLSKDDWSFFGQLRNYSHNGRLRIVFSCFQELFLRQQSEFTGPLVNFADILRLGVFTDAETEEFVTGPLAFWKPLSDRDRKALMALVTSVVGRHPFCLQYFCANLFGQVTAGDGGNLLTAAQTLLKRDLVECFAVPVDELFYKMPSPTLQYLFLRRCQEADQRDEEICAAVLEDDWVQQTLASLGYDSTLASRRNVLEGLEVHGLCVPDHQNRRRQVIAAPVMYLYVKREGDLDRVLPKLREDIRTDYRQYGLACATAAAARGGDVTHE